MFLRGLLRAALLCTLLLFPLCSTRAEKRPLTFVDIVSFRSVSALDISPDGKSAIFETLVPDWKLGKLYADVYHVSMEGGSKTARQVTNTRAADEKKPRWSRDGSFFVFLSNREAGSSDLQLFMMRPNGGEIGRAHV